MILFMIKLAAIKPAVAGTKELDDGLVIVRTHKAVNLPDRFSRLKVIERRKWGNMAVNILRETENEQ